MTHPWLRIEVAEALKNIGYNLVVDQKGDAASGEEKRELPA